MLKKMKIVAAMAVAFWMFAGTLIVDVNAQRTTTRSTTTRSTTGGAQRTTTTRTTTTRTNYPVYRGGTVVHGEEGYAAVGRRGAVVKGEEGAAAVGRRGVVVAGEEGFAAAGRHGVVVGRSYETYEAWRVVAGTAAVIAIGTMLARPPASATVIVVRGTSYWTYQNVYYQRVYVSGVVHYQVVARPL